MGPPWSWSLLGTSARRGENGRPLKPGSGAPVPSESAARTCVGTALANLHRNAAEGPRDKQPGSAQEALRMFSKSPVLLGAKDSPLCLQELPRAGRPGAGSWGGDTQERRAATAEWSRGWGVDAPADRPREGGTKCTETNTEVGMGRVHQGRGSAGTKRSMKATPGCSQKAPGKWKTVDSP